MFVNRVMEEVGECIVYWLGRRWQGRKQLLLKFGPPLTCYISSTVNS